ncbi:MAG: ATP-binding protein [Cyclobacteriaceae bacterium]
MVTEKISHNALDIKQELDWFQSILKTRSLLNAGKESPFADIFDIPMPDYSKSSSPFACFLRECNFGFEERFLLILSLVPHIKPELLDIFLQKNTHTNQVFTEFGGKRGKYHNGFLPTGETAMFILAGNDLVRRFALYRCFDGDHPFVKNSILTLEDIDSGEPFSNGGLSVSREVLDLLTTGEVQKPTYSASFPARRLSTRMEWEDLVLGRTTLNQLGEIENWIRHHHTLLYDWGMIRKLKPGYCALFYGPPGTGKSLTASLLGKRTGRDVYRIDLSKTISKYIGETEKNLAGIFDRAEHKDWILFFDEADALFGKRTNISDAHDRYANQEVSYLLQRIEEYNGLVILASNLKSNLDEAFTRRFQAMIQFPMPQTAERLQLWEKGFSNKTVLESHEELQEIARSYELSGGSIINVIQHSSLMALRRGEHVIQTRDIMDGIKREYRKIGRTI